ncbi:hypothetical protein BpHYR1_041762 [Brachionus plicatilis]|uniref:Uncharacterized protein n=1 Tax=Brachionus plicatilis TaxID=10195 RepID=A0A3M7Q430_BRAPC|nr:hypothetical protein BpHYR1_041762 [Brachionus plicatilis]
MKIYATGSQLNDKIFNFDFLLSRKNYFFKAPKPNFWAFSPMLKKIFSVFFNFIFSQHFYHNFLSSRLAYFKDFVKF